ncbi:unnamed protein product [Phytophthora lilii]|uniref:Unnamed protein product n=1 Tax=Phytophthora lilii TaxID=2077276 RepID=A0A9W6X527_9STRA|nr:unnamed protein product [Phytophthora lilii]
MTNTSSLLAIDGAHKDCLTKMAIVEGAGAPIKVQLWDTAGQEKFGAARLPNSFFRHANAAIVVYDVTNRQSFSGVLRWVMQIQAYQSIAETSFSLIVVGSKCDTSITMRQIRDNEGRKIARLVGASHFFECSSKHRTNVEECFDAVAATLVDGTAWPLSNRPLPYIGLDTTRLGQSPAPAVQTRDWFKHWDLDVFAAAPDTAARSPTLRVLSAKSPDLSVAYIGTLALLLSMPMVLLWLDDDAVLRWADAVGFQ